MNDNNDQKNSAKTKRKDINGKQVKVQYIQINGKETPVVRLGDIAEVKRGMDTGKNENYLFQCSKARGNYRNIDDHIKNVITDEELKEIVKDESTRVNLVKQGFSNENSGIYYKGKFIIPFDKGGESDADSGWLPNYYIPTNYFIDWSNKSVKSLYNRATFQSAKANLRNPDYWFKLGITYSARGVYSPSFRLNSSSVFDSNGSSIFFSNFSLIQGLALLSSKFYRFTLKNYCGHTIATEVDELKDGVIFIIPLKRVEQYVEAIINKQKQNPRYDYASNEQLKIDRLVCEAYGLNEDDVQEVENWYVRRYPKLAAAQKANLEAKQKAESK